MLLAEKSSSVRQEWSRFVDEVIHTAPKFVQRNERDIFVSMNLDIMQMLMEDVRYAVTIEYDNEAEEYIATMEDFWFVETGVSSEEAIDNLAMQLMDFSTDYYKELNVYRSTNDFKKQFPKVLKALIIDNANEVREFFDVQPVRP